MAYVSSEQELHQAEEFAERIDLEASVKEYLQAFSDRDLTKCVGFYTEDATIRFYSGVFRGAKAVEEWHRERFAANMQVLQVDRIAVQGSTVVLEATITSDRLKAWKMKRLGGKATFSFKGGRAEEVHFSPRIYNPLEGW